MTRAPECLARPHIRVNGEIGDATLTAFLDQLEEAGEADPLVVEVTTVGGDAEIGRRLALELRSLQAAGRKVLFLGKTVIYSAGVTMMAPVPAERRWLTPDAVLLVHCRKLNKTLELNEALRLSKAKVEGLLREIEVGMRLQQEGFDELARGSKVTADDVARNAEQEWYVPAEEAVELGLVAGIWDPATAAEAANEAA